MNDQRMLTPRLRFPEFRDGDWREVRLRDVADIKTGPFGSTLHQSDYVQTGTPIVTVEHLSEQGLVHKNLPLVSDEDKERLTSYILRAGDIVFSRVGSVDRNSLVSEKEAGWLFSGRLLRIRTDRNVVNPAFLSFYFQLETTKNKIRSVAVGQTMASLNTEILNDFPVATGNLTEQQTIADCLTSLDELIAAQGWKVEALKAHKKGLMQQLFPREDETRPRLRFPEFRDGPEWEPTPLEQTIEVASGQVNPTEPPYCDLPHVGGENIESDTGNLQGIRSAREDAVISGKYPFDAHDILYSKIRPALNKVAMPNFEGVCSADIYPIRPSTDELLRAYLVYLLRSESFVEYATKHSARGKIPKINREALLAYNAMLPPPAEQQRIADCLSTLDAQIAAETEKLAALKTHKKGLMQQLFPSPEGD